MGRRTVGLKYLMGKKRKKETAASQFDATDMQSADDDQESSTTMETFIHYDYYYYCYYEYMDYYKTEGEFGSRA